MLTRFVEHDVRPAFLRESQIHAVGGEVGEVAACVDGEIACIGFFKLRHADRAQNQICATHRFEDLYRAFFAKLLQTFLQLLDFQRIFDADAAEQFGREEGDAGERQLFAFGKAVADLDVAVVRDADDVAGVGFLVQRRFHVFRRPSDLFIHYLAQLLGNGLFCVTGANSNTFLRAFHCNGRIQF